MTPSPTRHDVGLLDTNVVILLPRIEDPDLLPRESLISTITLAELSAGPLVAKTRVERAERQSRLQQAEANFEALPIDRAVARAYGRVSADLREAGRKPTARSLDGMTAACAIANDLPLYTTNPSDFRDICGLVLVEVPRPA